MEEGRAADRQPRMTRIDLNADVGESFGRWTLGDEVELLRSVTSINVACGFHAGDPSGIRRTLRLARQAEVAVGAHPGLPDLVGFGRREMAVSPGEIEDLVLYQIGAVAALAKAEGMRLQHVKAHGALYTMANRDRDLAEAVAHATASFDPGLMLVGLPGSSLVAAGQAAGLQTIAEGFADRAYEPNGSLTPRSRPGAVIGDSAAVMARALRLVQEGRVRAIDESDITMRIDTLCIHGDTAGAPALMRQLRAALEAAGVTVARSVAAPAPSR